MEKKNPVLILFKPQNFLFSYCVIYILQGFHPRGSTAQGATKVLELQACVSVPPFTISCTPSKNGSVSPGLSPQASARRIRE